MTVSVFYFFIATKAMSSILIKVNFIIEQCVEGKLGTIVTRVKIVRLLPRNLSCFVMPMDFRTMFAIFLMSSEIKIKGMTLTSAPLLARRK